MRIPRDAVFPSLTRPPGFDVYDADYWLAAEHLYERNWGNSGMLPSLDFLSIPLLFLHHPFVELELKEIVRRTDLAGYSMEKTLRYLPPKGSHSLTKLLEVATENLTELWPKQVPLLDDKSIGIIDNLDDFGRRGEALRYPETTPAQGSSPTISSYYVADLPSVMRAMKKIRCKFADAIRQLFYVEDCYPDECQRENGP